MTHEYLKKPFTTSVPIYCFLVGLLGGVGSFFSFLYHPIQFYFSYLVAFMFFLTLSLGSLFFVIIQNLVRSGWSVSIRRIPEVYAMNLRLFPFLFLPILFGIGDLYYWAHPHVVLSDFILKAKSGYLNVPFFVCRALGYFVIWIWLARKFFENSTLQDQSGAQSYTLNSQKTSTYGVILFAITITFASIDWVMSLTPHWYSTMWGVYTFAGAIVGALSLMSLTAMFLRWKGYLATVISKEHFHDLGKLLYGFNVFWAYIAFSQYFLIWYANIPEETIWFGQHFHGSWNTVGIFLAVAHFAIPFLVFMSRHAKRNLPFHALVAGWMLMVHYVDTVWMISPNLHPQGLSIYWVDVSVFLAIGGLYFGFFLKTLSKAALYPLQDPRLKESLNLEVY